MVLKLACVWALGASESEWCLGMKWYGGGLARKKRGAGPGPQDRVAVEWDPSVIGAHEENHAAG